jgi:hypothetical protein
MFMTPNLYKLPILNYHRHGPRMHTQEKEKCNLYLICIDMTDSCLPSTHL